MPILGIESGEPVCESAALPLGRHRSAKYGPQSEAVCPDPALLAGAVLCCAVLCSALLCCCAVLYCAVLCPAVLCCAVLCCALLCCAVLCLDVNQSINLSLSPAQATKCKNFVGSNNTPSGNEPRIPGMKTCCTTAKLPPVYGSIPRSGTTRRSCSTKLTDPGSNPGTDKTTVLTPIPTFSRAHGSGYPGLTATTWVHTGAQIPVLSPNDHPNPSQG